MNKKQAPAQAPEQKPVINKVLSQKALSLREQFLNLPKHMQDASVHYFNLYNALGYWWNEILSKDARDYIDAQVMYARELQALENGELKEGEEV